jgi:hypothetical protein
MSLYKRPTLKTHIILGEEYEGGFVLDYDRLRIFFINKDGMQVLKFCDGMKTVEEIIKNFNCEMTKNVLNFLYKLKELEIITLE